ncbi:MAG: hypothetical protein ACYC7E_17480 [Armatimonadota bacterium]
MNPLWMAAIRAAHAAWDRAHGEHAPPLPMESPPPPRPPKEHWWARFRRWFRR